MKITAIAALLLALLFAALAFATVDQRYDTCNNLGGELVLSIESWDFDCIKKDRARRASAIGGP